jgi:hypothetical protein
VHMSATMGRTQATMGCIRRSGSWVDTMDLSGVLVGSIVVVVVATATAMMVCVVRSGAPFAWGDFFVFVV